MIYLIGGPPKSGKTTLAKRLSKLKGIPWVSTDTLQNVIKPYISKEDFARKFPNSQLRGESNDEKYTKYSTNQIIEAYQQQAKTVYPAVDMFVISEIKDKHDCIIEGYHIEPELAAELELKYPDKIKSVFIVKTDEAKFVTDIKKSTTPNDWIIARTKDESTYSEIAKMICKYGKSFEKESMKYGFKVINMDNDFDQQIQEAIKYLMIT